MKTHGTHITLHFKDNQLELLQEDKLKELIGKYSEFISFPIRLWSSRNETEEVPLTEEELAEQKAKEEKKDDEEIKVGFLFVFYFLLLMFVCQSDDEKKDEEKKEEKKTKSVTKLVNEWIHVNNKQPIWTRPASEISKEEYNDFYKHISKVDSESQFVLFCFMLNACLGLARACRQGAFQG
jgi:HSP90 family molecular chaperone